MQRLSVMTRDDLLYFVKNAQRFIELDKSGPDKRYSLSFFQIQIRDGIYFDVHLICYCCKCYVIALNE